jgi:hypothetical protein
LTLESVNNELITLANSNPRIQISRISQQIIDQYTKDKIGPAVYRYLHARLLLGEISKSTHSVPMVLLCDSRDLFFQCDPFATIVKPITEVFVALEPELIAKCPVNSGWIREMYPEYYDQFMERPIICSGTTLSNSKLMLMYLEEVATEIKKFSNSKIAIPHGGDQGIHNFLIHSGRIPKIRMCSNESSFFITCHHQKKFTFDRHGRILNKDGSVCPIVHQYDRVASLFDGAFFRSCFGRHY